MVDGGETLSDIDDEEVFSLLHSGFVSPFWDLGDHDNQVFWLWWGNQSEFLFAWVLMLWSFSAIL
jgi:hypothetical protein